MSEKPQFHGSDLELIERYYGVPKDHITSFSANINPLGISPMLRKSLLQNVDQIMTYPDREYTDLRKAIASYCGCSHLQILVGSGVSELLSRYIRDIHPEKTMLIHPAYSEYEREVRLSGGRITAYTLQSNKDFRLDVDALCDMLDSTYDLLILCNPNNPTGTAVHHKELRRIYDHCMHYGIKVLIDETYVEFTTDTADVTSIPLAYEYPNICILRGISKFFAAHGLTQLTRSIT